MASATAVGTWFTDTDNIDVTVPVASVAFTGYSAGILFVDERMGSGTPVAPQNGISGGFATWTLVGASPYAIGTVSGFLVYLGTGAYTASDILLDYSATLRLAATAIGYGLTNVETSLIRVGSYVSGTGTSATPTAPSSPAANSVLLAHTCSNVGTVAGTTTEANWNGSKVAAATPVLNATGGWRAASDGDTTFLASGWTSTAYGSVMLELPELVRRRSLSPPRPSIRSTW